MIPGLYIPSAMKTNEAKTAGNQSETPSQEENEVSAKSICWFFTILVISAIILHFAMGGLQRFLRKESSRKDRRQSSMVVEPSISRQIDRFPPPHLQTAPREDLKLLRTRED